jgi:hypothetical protein
MATKETRRLEVSEDLRFQHRTWRVQRVGWVVLALIVLAALAGLSGPGPLSNREATTDDLKVEYERFVRHGAQTELQVSIDASALRSGQASISISRDYLDSFNLQHVTPSPVRVQAGEDALKYVFASETANGSIEATFELQPDEIGGHSVSIALDGGPPVSIKQFTYP